MFTFTDEDKKFMKEALKIAETMRGRTSPDPMVGAVIVKDGQLISSGYHAEVTTPHAEAWALQKAGEKARGATMYVTLEPCCFFAEKNNPPCTKSIIDAGIKLCPLLMEDPNPSVAGKGFEELKDAGIEVEVGLFENDAKKLNEVFIKYISTNRPYVILKAAMSLDGKIATKTGESFWITGIESRRKAHHLRNIVDSVMVGIGTILKDDPHLNVRDIKGKIKNPKKIVLDPSLRIKLTSKVLKIEPENTIIVTNPNSSKLKVNKIKSLGAEVLFIKSNSEGFLMDFLMQKLGKRKITSILIEGGGNANANALYSGIVDKVYFFIAPKIIGGEKALTPVEGEGEAILSKAVQLRNLETERVGEDVLITGYVVK